MTLPTTQAEWDSLFPFDSYRQKQERTMRAVVKALHDPDIRNVILDAPTAVGKSGINTAAARSFEDAFYVTPQKSLREQLREDEVLSSHYETLRGRRDYICKHSGTDCDSCSVNQSAEASCMDQPDCTYWNRKTDAMDSDTAVLTFAYLITDGKIPVNNGNTRISFDNRELLVVDECHGLESQVSSLFAGFMVSPWSLPPSCFKDCAANLDMDNTTRSYQVRDVLDTLETRCKTFVSEHKGEDEMEALVNDATSFLDNLDWFQTEVDEHDRDWVVEMDRVRHPDRDGEVKSFKLAPVRVDFFLKNFVWSRGEKRLLSTATMPYRGNPNAWCRRIGLDPEQTHVIKVGMPIPATRRPIHLEHMVGEMSGSSEDENWEAMLRKLDDLAAKHKGENGLIHTSSYRRSESIFFDVRDNPSEYPHLASNMMLHDVEHDTSQFIAEWQDDSRDIMLSPSMMEGVDLAGDMCRWQALFKVPFPNIKDPRVDFLLDSSTGYGPDWQWYYESTANSIIQSVGRAVRSPQDRADYYVLDESFRSVRDSVALPAWFESALTEGATDPLQF